MEIEGEVSERKDEIEYLETELNDLKIQITKLQLDIEGDSLLRRKNKALQDKITQLFMKKWDHCSEGKTKPFGIK